MQRLVSLFALAVLLAGCAGPSANTDTLGSPDSPQKLYAVKCGKCHKFYNPAKYSDADWDMWMKKMGRKAKLTPQQFQELSQYIDSNLRGKGGAKSE